MATSIERLPASPDPSAYSLRPTASSYMLFWVMVVLGLGLTTVATLNSLQKGVLVPGVPVGIATIVLAPLAILWQSLSQRTFGIIALTVPFAALAAWALDPELAVVCIASLILAFGAWREWRRIGLAKQSGLQQWARSSFVWPWSPTHSLQKRAKDLSNLDLVGAINLPEHTSRSVKIAAAEAVGRGLGFAGPDPEWLPPAAHATLRFTRPEMSVADYEVKMAQRRTFIKGIRFVALLVLVALPIFLLLFPLLNKSRYELESDHGFLGDALVYLAVGTGGVAFIAFSCLPLLVMLGTYLGMNRSLRILLLRPFNQAQMTQALKNVVQQQLGQVGSVYTLSDKNYKPNLVLELIGKIARNALILLSPFIRPSFRIVNVKNERSFFILAHFLLTRWKASLRSLLSDGQAFNIRTTDAWWKRCIDLLMHSSDVVVMDISRVSTGSAWEMDQLKVRGLAQRCIFIAQEEYATESQLALQTRLGPGAAERLFVFKHDGHFTDDAAFQATFSNEWKSALTRQRRNLSGPNTDTSAQRSGGWPKAVVGGLVAVFTAVAIVVGLPALNRSGERVSDLAAVREPIPSTASTNESKQTEEPPNTLVPTLPPPVASIEAPPNATTSGPAPIVGPEPWGPERQARELAAREAEHARVARVAWKRDLEDARSKGKNLFQGSWSYSVWGDGDVTIKGDEIIFLTGYGPRPKCRVGKQTLAGDVAMMSTKCGGKKLELAIRDGELHIEFDSSHYGPIPRRK